MADTVAIMVRVKVRLNKMLAWKSKNTHRQRRNVLTVCQIPASIKRVAAEMVTVVNTRIVLQSILVEGIVRGVIVVLTNKNTTTANQAVAGMLEEERVVQITVMIVQTIVAHTEERDMAAIPVDIRVGERDMAAVPADSQMTEEMAAQPEETTVVQTGKGSDGMVVDGIDNSPVKWLNI